MGLGTLKTPEAGCTTLASPTVERICAVVVTYHPDSEVASRIERLARQVGQTVVVDNGSEVSCVEQLTKLADRLGLHLILNGENRGLAYALNTGARWAIKQGFRWILTLDQDTTAMPDLVSSLVRIVRECPFPERVAVAGSNYVHKMNGRLFRNVEEPGGDCSSEMITVVTSGSLVRLEALRAVGGFREDFFVDCIDHEFCLRARARGFHVMMSRRPLMEHRIGHLTEHRLLWRKVATANYVPERRYLMARNTFILAREYVNKEPQWVSSYLWAWIKSIVLVCLFEENRIAKVKRALRGCVDGLFWRTGTLN